MSSFATDVVVAQKPMCKRDDIKEAVDTLDKALHNPESPRAEAAKKPASGQMQLDLGKGSQKRKKQEMPS